MSMQQAWNRWSTCWKQLSSLKQSASLDGNKLSLAHRHQATGVAGILAYAVEEIRHLRVMRGGVIDHQHTARRQRPVQLRPPGAVLATGRIEKDKIVGAILAVLQHLARVRQ